MTTSNSRYCLGSHIVPIRPASLATMSAAIAGAVSAASHEAHVPSPVTLTFESGHHQVVEDTGCQRLDPGEGGLVAITATPDTHFVLFSGPTCRGARIVATGEGSAEYSEPVKAGSIVLG